MNKKRIKIVQWIDTRIISTRFEPHHFTKDNWSQYYNEYVKYYE